jgi:hypothetical protein
MAREILRLVGPKHAAFLALSLVLLSYLALRADTTAADLGFGAALVVVLWALAGVRAYMRRDQPRRQAPNGTPHAR